MAEAGNKEGEKTEPPKQNGLNSRLNLLAAGIDGGNPNRRLPSFRSSRDLDDANRLKAHLLPSHSKEVKKTQFKPNLKPNLKNLKPKVPAEPKTKSQDSEKKNEAAKKNGPQENGKPQNEGRKRFQRETVQTSGTIFDASTHFEKKDRSRAAGASDSAPSRAPKSAPRAPKEPKQFEVDEEADKRGKKQIEDDARGLDDEDMRLPPVTLPLNKNHSLYKIHYKPEDMVVKADPVVENLLEDSKEAALAAVRALQLQPDDLRNTAEFWQTYLSSDSKPNQFFLMQFPDFVPASRKYMHQKKQAVLEREPSGAGAASAETSAEQTPKFIPMGVQDLPEGFVGKLVRRRSGQSEVVFTSGIRFPVTRSTVHCKQEIMSIFLPDDRGGSDSQGTIVHLGSVTEKLVCVPDYEDLMAKVDLNSRLPNP